MGSSERKSEFPKDIVFTSPMPVGRILVVVYIWRGERVRLISVGPTTRRDATQYEEQYEEAI